MKLVDIDWTEGKPQSQETYKLLFNSIYAGKAR